MDGWKERTRMLFGSDGIGALASARVAVVGLGGVGAMAAEMLARAGVGRLVLVDADTVSETNINRQLPAMHSTLGRLKTEVVAARLRDINPELDVLCVNEYLTGENIPELLGPLGFDCLVDCIDTLSPKLALIRYCLGRGVYLVSSMGSGAKTDATRIRIDDISRTIQCPLARMIRKRLHKEGIDSGFLAVYSTERPDHDAVVIEESRNKKSQTGTVSYLPAAFGCACAQAAILHIVNVKDNQ